MFRRLKEFIPQAIGPNSEGMVVTYSRSLKVRQKFTSDPREILNAIDNCPDADSHGDVCDNCPEVANTEVANTEQADLDEDGTGDSCDSDVDADGTANGVDNCPYIANGAVIIASSPSSTPIGRGATCALMSRPCICQPSSRSNR